MNQALVALNPMGVLFFYLVLSARVAAPERS